MKSVMETAAVKEKARIADGMLRIALASPGIAAAAQPGQFVMVRTEATGAILGRPLGISGADAGTGTLTLRFAVAGKGTAWLADRRIGDKVSLYGPLGRGFTLSGGRCLLVGGGTGIAPLFFLKRRIEEMGGSALMVAGAKDRSCLMESDTLLSSCSVATEDGSAGDRGFVTVPLKKALAAGSFDRAYACGPVPMMKAVAALADEMGLPLQVSLETTMGCGTGACNGCTCKEAKSGEWWLKVCKDGPVFDAREVSL